MFIPRRNGGIGVENINFFAPTPRYLPVGYLEGKDRPDYKKWREIAEKFVNIGYSGGGGGGAGDEKNEEELEFQKKLIDTWDEIKNAGRVREESPVDVRDTDIIDDDETTVGARFSKIKEEDDDTVVGEVLIEEIQGEIKDRPQTINLSVPVNAERKSIKWSADLPKKIETITKVFNKYELEGVFDSEKVDKLKSVKGHYVNRFLYAAYGGLDKDFDKWSKIRRLDSYIDYISMDIAEIYLSENKTKYDESIIIRRMVKEDIEKINELEDTADGIAAREKYLNSIFIRIFNETSEEKILENVNNYMKKKYIDYINTAN